MNLKPIDILHNHIHVWKGSLQLSKEDKSKLSEFLTENEMLRGKRLFRSGDRDRSRIARGLLRLIMARYLNITPASLIFVYNKNGKPALADSHRSDIQFNLSHKHDRLLIAVCRVSRIGVDLEKVNPGSNHLRISKRFFSDQENADLISLPEEQQRDAFFTCWTRKEAYIKAKGLSVPTALKGFSVSLKPDDPPLLVGDTSDPEAIIHWSLFDVETADGYRGAVAVEGQNLNLSILSLSSDFA